MRISTRSLLSAMAFGLAGLMLGLVIASVKHVSDGDERRRIRAEFFKRHEYRKTINEKLKLRLDSVTDKLYSYSEKSARHTSDSVQSLIEQSLVTLIRCNEFAYEIKELDKGDSLLFERYSK